ncbi:hypothetical protein DFH06DRAFT_548144 [Mycena polygramma]|nr:hypothetical protein DFH06DRAFT_548144 [Mycena polygramma]
MLTGMARGRWFGQTNQAAEQAAQPLPIPVVSADAKKFGLENFGNTCYANSVIQALYFCTPFRDLLIQATDTSLPAELPLLPPPAPAPAVAPIAPVRRKPERKASTSEPNGLGLQPPIPGIPPSPPSLFSALRSLFVHISTNPAEKGTVAPRAFIDKLKEFNELFRSTMHQDAHEFLNYLLNKIVEEIEEDRKAAENGSATPPIGDDLSLSVISKNPTLATTNSGTSPQNATLVHKLFEGVLTSETRCLTCENVSSRDESFLDLSIDIEQNASVTACLRQFSASEMLCQKNKFFCDVCCDLQEAEKRMKIKKLPNVLALHLKRFKYQEDVGKYIKLAYRVAFPFELRLFNTVDDIDDADRLFNLFGIVVHIGSGPHHGHYISIIKTMGSWLVFDDDNVYPISEADIPKYFGESNSGSAYVLYYQAVDIDLPALGLRPPPVVVDVETLSHLEASPSAALNPPLPPGLAEEADLSDTSDPSFPVTPPSPEDPRPPIDMIMHGQPEEVASTSLPTKPKGGLFHTLKRTPSTSTRPSTAGADARRSIQSNGTSPTFTSDDDAKPLMPPPFLPLPPPAIPTSNGKEKEKDKDRSPRKEPERKASLWFGRRKSFRLGDKSRPDDDVPPSPVVPRTEASSSTWFLSSGPSHDKHRRPSEPTTDSARGSKTISAGTRSKTRPKSTGVDGGGGLTVKPERGDGMNGYDSPSPGSASSSFVSVNGSPSVSTSQHSVVDFPPARTTSLAPPSLPQPPPPPLPDSQAPPPPSIASKLSLHKKSMSNLSSPKEKKSSKSRGPPTVVTPPRPSTAGAATAAPDVSATRSLPPVPPIRDWAGSPTPPTRLLNGDALLAGVPPTGLDKGKTRAEGGGGDETDGVPLDLPSSPVGLGSFAGANNSTSSTSSGSNGSSANPKRATRKMSLTSPLLGLGFGKKDKHKDKEKSPSSFYFGKT